MTTAAIILFVSALLAFVSASFHPIPVIPITIGMVLGGISAFFALFGIFA